MCKCEKKMVQIMKLNTCTETLNLHENGARHIEKNQLRSFRARFIYMHVKIILSVTLKCIFSFYIHWLNILLTSNRRRGSGIKS